MSCPCFVDAASAASRARSSLLRSGCLGLSSSSSGVRSREVCAHDDRHVDHIETREALDDLADAERLSYRSGIVEPRIVVVDDLGRGVVEPISVARQRDTASSFDQERLDLLRDPWRADTVEHLHAYPLSTDVEERVDELAHVLVDDAVLLLVTLDARNRLDGKEAYDSIDLGPQQLRGRAVPVRVYAVEPRMKRIEPTAHQ